MPHGIVFIKLDCFSVVFCKNHSQAVEERIRVLKRFQGNSVDAILGEIVQTASSKNLPFCKDALLEQVLQLKAVHGHGEQARDGRLFFGRFQSLKEKFWFQKVSFAGTCLFFWLAWNSKRCLTECPRW